MILTGGFGDDAGTMLQSPLDANLQHNHYSNPEYLGNHHTASLRQKEQKSRGMQICSTITTHDLVECISHHVMVSSSEYV